MTLEETIQMAYDQYPSISQKRWQVLDHLFCVIGNGYEWVDGELVSTCGDFDFSMKPILGDDGKSVQRNVVSSKMDELFKKEHGIEISEFMQFYPLAEEYSYLLNYPEDIKSDWLAGIEETKELFIESLKQPLLDEKKRFAKQFNEILKENKEIAKKLGWM